MNKIILENSQLSLVPAWILYLLKAGTAAPSPDNSQPWRFVWDGDKLELRLDETLKMSELGSDHPVIGLAMGTVIENMMQAAVAAGLPANALHILPDNDPNVFLRVQDSADYKELVFSENLPLFKRHTNRLPFYNEPLESSFSDKLHDLQSGEVDIALFQDRDDIAKIADFIKRASQARFQNEQIHKWFAASLRFTKSEVEEGDGLDIDTLALPPGGRWLLKLIADWSRMSLLNRFGAYKIFASIEASSFQECGAVVAVSGNWDTPGDSVLCGRVVERVWIALNQSGYAVHPYFVLSDQLYRLNKGLLPDSQQPSVKKLADEAVAFFNLKQKSLVMLLRVGKPKGDSKQSLRVPLTKKISINKNAEQ